MTDLEVPVDDEGGVEVAEAVEHLLHDALHLNIHGRFILGKNLSIFNKISKSTFSQFTLVGL